jgi:hypothetical protein
MSVIRPAVTPSTPGCVAVIVLAFGLQAVDSQASPTLESAQRFFYNGDYGLAAAGDSAAV